MLHIGKMHIVIYVYKTFQYMTKYKLHKSIPILHITTLILHMKYTTWSTRQKRQTSFL